MSAQIANILVLHKLFAINPLPPELYFLNLSHFFPQKSKKPLNVITNLLELVKICPL